MAGSFHGIFEGINKRNKIKMKWGSSVMPQLAVSNEQEFKALLVDDVN